ncbi:MAG: hypothetical protein ABNH00_03930 [Dokdonia sp.]|jgi:hypothetical protein
MTAFFIIAAVIIAAIVTARILVRKKVTRLMMVPSPFLKEAPDASAQKEVKAAYTLTFDTYTHAQITDDMVEARTALNKKALRNFRYVFGMQLLAALGYIVFTQGNGFFIGVPFAFLSTMRYLTFKDQFRPHHKGLAGFLKPFKNSFLEIVKPEYAFHLALIAMAASILVFLTSFLDWRYDFTNLGYLVAILFHLFLLKRTNQKLKKTHNLKLLLLRVFGINDAAAFTFEGLLKYWEHFGSFFTVVDPSYLKSVVRRKNQILPLVATSFFVIIFAELIAEDYEFSKDLLHYGILLPLIVVASIWYIQRSLKAVDAKFTRDQAHLNEKIAALKANPRTPNNTFKHLPTMCYDDTWKMAVANYVTYSDVILMDLRGYSKERQGCGYEVDYLFDHTSVDKLVFLISAGSLPLIEDLMQERWEYLKIDSPNRHNTAPKIALYESTSERNKDIQGLLDLLIFTASNYIETRQPQQQQSTLPPQGITPTMT